MTQHTTHGREFTGTVVKARMQKTVTVAWERRKHYPKYERYAKEDTTIKAHNPDDINASEGDTVRIKETKPISKTKNFIVTEIIEEGET